MSCMEHAGSVQMARYAKPDTADKSFDLTIDLTKDLALHYAMVRLLINPIEKDHQALIAKMEEMMEKRGVLAVKPANSELAVIAQKVLKREWERVKTFQ